MRAEEIRLRAQDFMNNGLNGVITWVMAKMASDECKKDEAKSKYQSVSFIQFEGVEDIMKNVRKRNDGRWEWRKVVNGVRYDIVKPTQNQLIAAVKELKNNKKQEKLPIIKKIKYTLIEWCYYWVDTYKNTNRIKPRTITSIKGYFRNYIEGTELGKMDIRDITTDVLQNFFNKKEPSRTKELVLLYVKAALKKAKGLNYIKTDLFEEFSADVKQNNIAPPFSYDEQVSILEALENTKIKPVIMFYLLTGIRRNELPKTKNDLLAALDIKNNLIKIKCEKKRNNRIVYRFIDLSPAAVQYILKNVDAIYKFSLEVVYRTFKDLLAELKIKGNLKTLRHTFTTNHWYLGNPDKLISSWLGHETVDLTQKVYIFIDRSITKEKILNLYGDLYYLQNNITI